MRILDGSKRDDADLRGDVLQALMLDGLVPMTVDAKVRDGLRDSDPGRGGELVS